MTVDFPISYPANTAPANKPVDIQTLQEAFAAALQNYRTDTEGKTANTTLLEAIRSIAHTDSADDENRNQHRREQQHTNRNDFANVDRTSLNKSEMRNIEMDSDYRDRIDRHETLRCDYQEKIEQSERQQVQPPDSPNPATCSHSLPDVVRLKESVLPQEHLLLQQNVLGPGNVNSQPFPANAPNSVPVNGVTDMLMPGRNFPVSMSVPVTQPIVPTQVFTIFSPAGRLSQPSKKANENDNEDEESAEEKETMKPKPFAVFEAIHAESIQAARQNVPRKPERPQTTEQPKREKLKEAEPNPLRSVETLKELVNTPAQAICVSTKGEQSNQTQYLNRITAACEAASHYAPIRIKLNLDHLGTLTLRFFFKAEKLTLRFETPSKESAQFLHENLDRLRSILSKRNLKIVDIEILSD